MGLLFGSGLLLVMSGGAGRARNSTALAPPDWRGGVVRGARSVVVALFAALSALLVTGIPVVALLAGALGSLAPTLVKKRSEAKRRRERAAAWPDAIDSLAAGVRAGLPLGEALAELATRGPDALRSDFGVFAAHFRAGASLRAALAAMRNGSADPVADRVAVSVELAAQSGSGQTVVALATLADFLRADLRMRSEIEARQSWTVNAARVAVAAPWVAVALLSTRTESATAYASSSGALLLVFAAAASAVAYVLMRAVAALPTPSRLAPPATWDGAA